MEEQPEKPYVRPSRTKLRRSQYRKLQLERGLQKPYEDLTPKQKLFVDEFVKSGNATASARAAGYAMATQVGPEMKKLLRFQIEERRNYQPERHMSDEEVLEVLTQLARDVNHKDRLRAVELLLKLRGSLSDSLAVKMDRKTLLTEISKDLERIRQIER